MRNAVLIPAMKYCFFGRTVFFAVIISACAGVFAGTGKPPRDLRDILRQAAANGQKSVSIEGKYAIDRPLEFDSSFSGMTIDGGGKCVISGGRVVKGWTRDGKFLKAKVDFPKIEALFVNGRRANVAQGNISHFYSQAGDDINAVVVRNGDLGGLEAFPADRLSGAYFDCYAVWINIKCPIVRIEKNPDGETSTVFIKNPGDSLFKRDKNPRFRISNAFAVLDEPGEFCFEQSSKTLWYFPRSGEDASNITAVYPVISRLVRAAGESPEQPLANFTIKGVVFEHAGHLPKDARSCYASQAAFNIGGAVFFENVKNLAFKDNVVRHTNTYGLEIRSGAVGAAVLKNEFFDNGAGGIRVGDSPKNIRKGLPDTKNIEVADNIVYSYGRYDKAGVGIIYFDVGNIKVDHNTVFDGYYSGISGGWTWGYAPTKTIGNSITNNRIFNIGYGLLCDMGGIYTLGSHKNSVISGNEISGVRRHRYGGWGIYNDEGSADFIVENNYAHHNSEDGYHQHYGLNNVVRNNIFAYGDVSQIALSRLGVKYPDELVFERNVVMYRSPARLFRNAEVITRLNGKFDSNLYWNDVGKVEFFGMELGEWRRKYGQDKSSVLENPEFKDGAFGSDAYKKIGFKPFSTKGAGVRGKMKRRLKNILENYEYPPTVRVPIKPEWTVAFKEDLSGTMLGGRPPLAKIDSANGGFDVSVLEDKSGRFVRYVDSFRKSKPYMPTSYYNVSLAAGKRGRLSFEIRVGKSSTFFVECRGDTGFPGPMLNVVKGKIVDGKRTVALPLGKWLGVEIVFKQGADKSYSLRVCDGKTPVFNAEKLEYGAAPMSSFGDIVVAQTSNEDNAYFDIRNMDFGEASPK